MRIRALLALLVALFAPALAAAHPHVWVDTASEMLFDEEGRIAAIRHHWRFDEAFSAYALQGLDVDRDGKYSREELEPLARENVESLSEYGFFTVLTAGGEPAAFAEPTRYHLDLDEGRLTLHFTMPLAEPRVPRGKVVLEIFDPEFYVDFSIPSVEAVRLVDAPAACRLDVHPAEGLSADAAAALATIGPDQRQLPADMKGLATGIANSADLDCGIPRLPITAKTGTAKTAGDALSEMAGGGDLTALPAAGETPAPQPAALSAPAPAASPSLFARFMARIVAWQTTFNRALTDGLKQLGAGGTFWWLGGLSFLYGIVHAAGPGHGKVVISTYLVANEARIRRGVAIAFLAAFAQAVVAVAVISVMAAILNMTSMAIDSTAKVFEAGSFALVAALGLYLLARKGREAAAAFLPPPLRGRAGEGGEPHASSSTKAHDHQGHDHGHGAHCHHHHVAPTDVRPGLAGALAAIVSVGIRPCSGALVVLVFALAQGVFWAGIAATFLMALGTALTVAVLAALAVGAKAVARRLAAGGGGQVAARVQLGLELAAAFLITGLGTVLFAGAVAA